MQRASGIKLELEIVLVVESTIAFRNVATDRIGGLYKLPSHGLTSKGLPCQDLAPNIVGKRFREMENPQALQSLRPLITQCPAAPSSDPRHVAKWPNCHVTLLSRRYIDKQPQRHERFRIPHSPLDPTKMGRGLDDVQDVHSFDIRLHHLRLVGLQGGNLVLQDTVNIHKDVGGKVLRGWTFVEEHISCVPRCRDCRDGKVSMVLMCIILGMNENEIRPDIENHTLDALNTLAVQGDGGIRILPPIEPRDAKDISGGSVL